METNPLSPSERAPSKSRRPAFAGRSSQVLAFALVGACGFILAPRPAQAEGDADPTGPCDGLVRYVREALETPAPAVETDFVGLYQLREGRLEDRLRSTLPAMPGAYIGRVTPACRAETRRGAAPVATEAARELAKRPEEGWMNRGRILLCTMQDPASLIDAKTWTLDSFHPEARAVCMAELATWPDLGPWGQPGLARAVQTSGSWGGWEIDTAVVASANVLGTPELREQLVPVLAAAHERRALGYDRLRTAVCTNDGAMSADRLRACLTLPAGAEQQWSRSERPGRWLARGGLTAAYAGTIAVTTLERDHDAGRVIATAAGAVGGYVTGVGALVVVTTALHYPSSNSDELGFKALILGSAIAGGVLGGVAAHAIASSPGARAPVTAVGLAPLYLTILSGTFD